MPRGGVRSGDAAHAGEIAFGRRGAKLGVGVYTLPNADYSRGVALAGALDCIYRRR